jgi:hypothetical protein
MDLLAKLRLVPLLTAAQLRHGEAQPASHQRSAFIRHSSPIVTCPEWPLATARAGNPI